MGKQPTKQKGKAKDAPQRARADSDDEPATGARGKRGGKQPASPLARLRPYAPLAVGLAAALLGYLLLLADRPPKYFSSVGASYAPVLLEGWTRSRPAKGRHENVFYYHPAAQVRVAPLAAP
jgi:hypothetical protein